MIICPDDEWGINSWGGDNKHRLDVLLLSILPFSLPFLPPVPTTTALVSLCSNLEMQMEVVLRQRRCLESLLLCVMT